MTQRTKSGHHPNHLKVRQRVATNIKDMMYEQRLSVRQLADDAGISRSHMSNILNSIHNPSLETLIQVADALDVRVAELLIETYAEVPNDYCR